jgi:alkylation response protein AidB-like acyl-CoA dehydrogenase
VSDTTDLESALTAVEAHLAALGDALKAHDPGATEAASAALHRALSAAVDRSTHSARHGGMPPALRRRLALAGASVAAQREAVARAATSLDRAIEILLPETGPAPSPVYGAQGNPWRASSSGVAEA